MDPERGSARFDSPTAAPTTRRDAVTREAIAARYRAQGCALAPGVLDASDVDAATAYCDTLAGWLGVAAGTPVLAAPPGDEYLTELVATAGLGEIAAAALGGPAGCFGATYLDKQPGRELPADWHQDGGPWQERLHGAAALTVWVALSDADERSGCLRVIPGSQTLALQVLRPTATASLFGVAIDPALVDEARAVALPVQAGDAIVHSDHVVHASFPNRSGRRRLALAFRFACEKA